MAISLTDYYKKNVLNKNTPSTTPQPTTTNPTMAFMAQGNDPTYKPAQVSGGGLGLAAEAAKNNMLTTTADTAAAKYSMPNQYSGMSGSQIGNQLSNNYDPRKPNITAEQIKESENRGKAQETASQVNSQPINTGAVATTPVTPTTPTAFTPPDISSQIKELYGAQEKARMAQLEQSRQKALALLEQEKATIAPKFYDARNQAAAMSQQQARNFAEYMANRGQASSGMAAQGEINRGMALQGTVGNLNRDEVAAMNDIARRSSDLQQAYNQQEIEAMNDIAAQRSQMYVDQANRNVGYQLQGAGLTGYMPDGSKTLGARQLDQDQANTEWQQDFQTGRAAADDANTQWSQTFQTGRAAAEDKNTAWGQQFQEARAAQQDEESQRDFDFKVGQFTEAKRQWEMSFKSDEAQRVWQRNFEEDKFDFDKESTKWEQGFKKDQFTWQKAQQDIDNKFRQKQADIQNAFEQKKITMQEKDMLFNQSIAQKQMALESAKFAFSKAQASRSSGGGGGGSRSSGSSSGNAPTKKSLYYSEAEKAAGALVERYEKDDRVTVMAKDGKTLAKDWLRTPGSTENKAFWSNLANAGITEQEAYIIAGKYNVPGGK